MFACLGYNDLNKVRTRIYEEIKIKGYKCASYISPNLHSIEEVDCGENCFILDGQTINPDVKIGNNVTIWTGNHVGDRTIIEDNVWISSQVAIGGDVVVGDSSFVGMNATIAHDVKIGARNFIGAATLITQSTLDDACVCKKEVPKNINSSDFIRITQHF